jgi:hypothetical protein
LIQDFRFWLEEAKVGGALLIGVLLITAGVAVLVGYVLSRKRY